MILTFPFIYYNLDWKNPRLHVARRMRVKHHKQIIFDYSLHNQTLENAQSAKDLGITITDNMDWGQHVLEISSKATKTLGFLCRNLAFARLVAPRSTKEVAYKTLVRSKLEYAAPIWSPHSKLQIYRIEKVQRTAARLTCRRWQSKSSVGEMLEWPSLEAWRDQSSLLLFHKIHFGAVSIEKDQYMTSAHSLKTTRSSHSAQYRRHQTYSDALKNSFFPRTIPHWNSLSPSVANTQSTEEFRALLIYTKIQPKAFVLFCFFVLFLFFYSIKISKFALPGVMLKYDRTSKDRKKESRPWVKSD